MLHDARVAAMRKLRGSARPTDERPLWAGSGHMLRLFEQGPLCGTVTDKLRSYGAAMKVIGNAPKQVTGRWQNNRAENSHLPFRRRERAMLRFRQMRNLQKFGAVYSSIHNNFNQERHLYSRTDFKLNRTAALAEWRGLCAA
jgi:hypothetical protein